MEQAPIERDRAACCRVRVSIDTVRIRAGFGNEKPPVPVDEWNAAGYVEHRKSAYRAALDGIRTDTPGGPVVFEVFFEEAASDEAQKTSDEAKGLAAAAVRSVEVPPGTGDRVRLVLASPDHDAGALDACAATACASLRAVFADTGGWRLFLLPAYFARHRAWRGAVGSPIQH